MTCQTGKDGYPTSAAADRVRRGMLGRTGLKGVKWNPGKLSVFRCKFCHQWHVGNSVAPVKNRKPRHEPVCDWSAA